MKKNIVLLTIILGLMLVNITYAEMQEITLQPGWNAVYLTVQPTERDWKTVLAEQQIQVEAIWRWMSNPRKVDFTPRIIHQQPDWLVYYPADHALHAASTLTEIIGGKAYLIQLPEHAAVQHLTLQGTYVNPKITWAPNQYKLVGFPVDENQPPNFQDYFEPSTAHQNLSVYKMVNGNWEEISYPGTELIEPGRAYWIYSAYLSDYTGPLSVSTNQMEFGTGINEQSIKITEKTTGIVNVQVQGTSQMQYATSNTINTVWEALPLNSKQTLELSSTSLGQRFYFAIANLREHPQANGSLKFTASGMKISVPITIQQTNQCGVWAGTVAVSQVQSAEGDRQITPTGTAFQFRLILGVDENQQVFLLDNVQTGTTVRDGKLFPKRISTASYNVKEPTAFTGTMGGTLKVNLLIKKDDPINPFAHKYHPIHRVNPDAGNNLESKIVEPFQVKREIILEFTEYDPRFPESSPKQFSWGANQIGGKYTEVLTGLHKNSLIVKGYFYLERMNYSY